MIDKARESHDPNWGRRIYELAFDADTRNKMQQLPLCFFKTFDRVRLEGFESAPSDGLTTMMTMRYDCEVDMSGLPFPNEMPKGNPLQMGWRGCKVTYDPSFYELAVEFNEWCQRIRDAEDKRDQFVDGVKKVLENFSTLAPALKAWPALWDLVPDDKKEKHKEIVERKKSGPTELEIDTSSLTAAVTMAKLTR
jgi:hypothetical protein